MAEEEKDDWLNDVDEDDDSMGELDQSDIDSLLSGDPAASAETPSEESDDEELMGELDQSDIDSLLAGDDAPPAAPEESSDDNSMDELDQSDIDSLLTGGEDTPSPAAEESTDAADSDGELDQSDIDSLLSGDAPAAQSAEAAEADNSDQGDDSEIDQSDIDALLSGDFDSDGGDDATEISPDQEEIDKLFSESDEEPAEDDPFQAEEIDFQDIFDDTEGDDSFLSTGNEFDDEEFDLEADIPDIPDIPGDDDETAIFGEEDESTKGDDDNIFDGLDEETVLDDKKPGKFKIPEIPLPPVLQNRRNQGIAGGVIALLLVALIFVFSGGDDEPQFADTPPEEELVNQSGMAQEPTDEAPETASVNTAPMTDDLSYLIETDGPLAVLLEATDAESDELSYEVLTEPEHGKLSGQPPYLIYTPNKDFPGEDIFNFRVNDGQDFSPPAMVKISGDILKVAEMKPEPPAEAAKKEKKEAKPKKLVISAKNISYNVTGNKSFYLDWERIWDHANYLPYTSQVSVEIFSDDLQGKLKKINNQMHRYQPQKFVETQENIRYRFKLGKVYSNVRTVNLQVSPGNPAPEIVLQPIAPSYTPGEMVLLDASATMDEDRNSLIFSWQQIAGVPVKMEVLNQKGSKISFIVPSSFNTSSNAGPLIRLTTIDKSGQQDVVDIKIPTKSRRRSALWGGLANR